MTSDLRVSARRDLSEALILATGIPFKGHGDLGGMVPYFRFHLHRKWRVSAAMAQLRWISPGWLLAAMTAFWEADLQVWDVAAGISDGP